MTIIAYILAGLTAFGLFSVAVRTWRCIAEIDEDEAERSALGDGEE